MNHPWYTASSDAFQPDPTVELSAIIAAMEDLIMVFDRQGRCLKMAPTNEKLLVKEAAEQIGKSVYENLPADQADLHFQAIQQTLATQQTSSFEYRMLMNGQEAWFSAKVSPLTIDTVVMVSRDVTSLKQAEAELRSFFAAMPDVTLVFNDEGRILKVLAPKNRDLFVAAPNDLVGKALHELLPVDVANLQLRYTRQCLAAQQVISNIEYSLMLNGNEAWFSATVSPLSENTVIWVARDVSDRKRSEREREQAQVALQQSEQRNRAILDAIPDLIFRLNHDGIYLGYVKPNLLQDLMPQSLNPVGRHVSECIPSEVAERHLHAVQQALATGQIHIYEQEVMINDRRQYEEVRVVTSGENEAVFMVRDISDRKQAEAALQESLKQLAAANQEITLLNQQLQSENLRMSAELAIARQLQQMVLPKEQELQQVSGLNIAAFMQPADEIGGDYYDVLQHNGQVQIAIGDVMGHGLESGVLMLMVQTAVRTLLEHQETDLTKFLTTLNRVIYKNVQRMNSNRDITLVLLHYQPGSICLCGQHEEVLVIRNGGLVERIDTSDLGFPLGLVPDIADFVGQTEVALHHGDVVVLYTDGITEAENTVNKLYGIERLCQVVSQNWHHPADEIRRLVIDDVRQHIGDQKILDDLTLLVLKQK